VTGWLRGRDSNPRYRLTFRALKSGRIWLTYLVAFSTVTSADKVSISINVERTSSRGSALSEKKRLARPSKTANPLYTGFAHQLDSRAMKLQYFWSSDEARKPFPGERNAGIEAVPDLLKQMKARGADVEFVDTAHFTEKARIEAYSRVALPAVYRHYEIKRMLGTNRRSGCFFGAEVPALLVMETDSPGDTFPHRKGDHIVTIRSYLTDFLTQG
jgi:hypothetical protein